MNRSSYFILLLLAASLSGHAQNILTGQVLDSLTKKPVPFANVFFANTTIGTVTDTSGFFALHNIPSGKYDLTISFVGYNTYQRPITFFETQFKLRISLSQQVTQLSEIVVRADTAGWRHNYNIFKELFVGLTRNATNVAINNPRDLRFYYDRSDQVLLGFGQKPIAIENLSLGYRIYYELVQFEYSMSAGRLVYFGIPRFEELKPEKKSQANRWRKERERAYYGSSHHFFQALKQNKLQANGFTVFYLHRVPNRNRPNEVFLNNKIKYWRDKLGANGRIYLNKEASKNDSLGYYLKLRNEPKIVDSLGRQLVDAREIFVGQSDVINYQGLLKVIYDEREELNYAKGRPPANKQQSVIHFLGKQVKIYDNGYYENIMDILFEGYMGWSEKIAELLPLEYLPLKE